MGIDAEMFARIRGEENWLRRDELKQAAYELASVIGSGKFFINDEHHALEIVTVWYQDGPDIRPEEGEQFVKVNLWSRYYSEDYARGDWLTIKAVADWLEYRFAGCEVWYGGDSLGVCAERFSAARRDELHKFFLSSGRKSYVRAFGWGDEDKMPVCPACEVKMFSCGGGGSQVFCSCDGCGKRAIQDGDKTRWLEDGSDFFSPVFGQE